MAKVSYNKLKYYDNDLKTTVIADKYDSTKTYKVNDYCVYSSVDNTNNGGSLYRCIVAITTAEAWTAAHWTKVNIGDDLGPLSRRIDDVTNTTHSLSGSVVTLDDGVDGAPLKKCIVNVTAWQEGSGDASPTNQRPIHGWSAANLFDRGKNLLRCTLSALKSVNTNGTWSGSTYTLNGMSWTVNTDAAGYVVSIRVHGNTSGYPEFYFPYEYLPAGSYVISMGGTVRFRVYENNVKIVDGTSDETIIVTSKTDSYIFTLFPGSNNVDSLSYPMLRKSTDTSDFEPYKGKQVTVQFGDTYYGGQYNYLTGVLTVTTAKVNFTKTSVAWDLSGSGKRIITGALSSSIKHVSDSTVANILCNKFKAASSNQTYQNVVGISVGSGGDIGLGFAKTITKDSAWEEIGDSIDVVYELATPQTIQLTPQEVTLLANTNTIWADCGNVSIEYGGYIGSLEDAIARLTARVAALENA